MLNASKGDAVVEQSDTPLKVGIAGLGFRPRTATQAPLSCVASDPNLQQLDDMVLDWRLLPVLGVRVEHCL